MFSFRRNRHRGAQTCRGLFYCVCATVALAFGSAADAQGLPRNLPAGLPADLLLTPFEADFVWVERWGSNDAWSNAAMWRTGAQVEAAVEGDNSILIVNRDIYRETLQELPVPDGSPPNSAGARVWVGTAEPEGESGNDNIDVGETFTLGELTVQNVSLGAGRSFRNAGILVFDSGDPARNARIVHLGDEFSDGDDMNIREATDIRLDSPTEVFLLNTGSRFRVRGQSRIFGTGDLILNPGDHVAYSGEATGQGPEIARELRVEEAGRIATEGRILINAARLRLTDSGDIANASDIFVNPGGQLMLDRSGMVAYALGAGPIRINSEGHEMDGGNNGALRQEAGEPEDVATVINPLDVLGDSRLHARNDGTLVLTGDISGIGQLRKTGEGVLRLEGVARNTAGWDVTNGTLEVIRAEGLPNAPLRFGSAQNRRQLVLRADQTVSLLDGDAPDPDEPDAENTLSLTLAAGATLTVDQEMLFEGDEEESTRFQGAITGAGDFVKAGDGILRFTRWPKTHAGETIVRKGVLAVSESAALANTAALTVRDGGQLRLSTSGGDVRYRFGGELSLAGRGREGGVTIGDEQGVLGALRYDPGGEASTATIESDVWLAEDTTIHINGLDKTLVLEGAVAGPGTLTRSGGGTLTVAGSGDLTGSTRIENGITRVHGNASLGVGALEFIGASNNATVDFGNTVQEVGDLFGGGTESTLFVRDGSRLRVGGGPSSVANPFRGVITGGGTLVKHGNAAWQFEGFLSGLDEIRIESGSAAFLTGASQIGSLRVDSGAEARFEGVFSSVPLRVDGHWLVENAGQHEVVFRGASVNVRGGIYFTAASDASIAPVRVEGDLIFEEGAFLSLPSEPGAAFPGVVHDLISVDGTLQGMENVSVAAPAGTRAELRFSDGVLSVLLHPTTGDVPAELLDAIGEVDILDDGRFQSPWLGVLEAPGFSDATRWIFAHEQTWWWAAPGATDGEAWFYDVVLGWLWTGGQVYPFLYSHGNEAWLFHWVTVESERVFHDFGDDPPSWIGVPFLPAP